MYPLIRIDKIHPDGSPRAACQAYRIADAEGAVRLWTPANTPLIHVNGRWSSRSAHVITWRPGDAFVAHYYEDADGQGLYIDIVREVVVAPERFTYIDLYVDVLYYRGQVTTKDEALLANLDPEEASRVLRVRDDLVRSIIAGDPPFVLSHSRWRVSDETRALPPGVELDL